MIYQRPVTPVTQLSKQFTIDQDSSTLGIWLPYLRATPFDEPVDYLAALGSTTYLLVFEADFVPSRETSEAGVLKPQMWFYSLLRNYGKIAPQALTTKLAAIVVTSRRSLASIYK
jgi:hypothetical protein